MKSQDPQQHQHLVKHININHLRAFHFKKILIVRHESLSEPLLKAIRHKPLSEPQKNQCITSTLPYNKALKEPDIQAKIKIKYLQQKD